jgi:hypothetical protein
MLQLYDEQEHQNHILEQKRKTLLLKEKSENRKTEHKKSKLKIKFCD